VWKAKGLGVGFSTPSIASGRIFSMGNIGKDECVMALDLAHEGRILWSKAIGPVRANGGGYPGPRCTPTVDGDCLYALGINGDLVCLDVATGNQRWHKDLVKEFGGKMMSMWGFSESPLVDGEKLVCTPGGRAASIVALNKHTGDVIWKSVVPQGDHAGYSSVVVAEVDGLRQYVQLLGQGVVGVDAKDGRFLWRYNRMANHVANIPTPIVRDNYVFCSTAYNGGSALLRLERNGDTVSAKEVYYLAGNVLQNHHGGLVLVGDYIYGGHGHNKGAPVCIKFLTGEVVWKKDPGPGDGSAAVLFADGELYFRFQNGLLALIEATPAGYHEKGRFMLPDRSGSPSWPHPVIAHGQLFVRDQDTLLCYDVTQH
jgi:outer membrane protein assembly factor BamB